MANFVDSVAMTLPWAGGLVPATLTYQNLMSAGFEWWQAAVVAGVVEGMGFVSVTTAIDIYEHNRSEEINASADSWNAPRPVLDGAFWISLGGVLLYLVAVLVINTILDGTASLPKIITGGLLSTFGVLGGVMVALRNQLGKRRLALQISESRTRQAEAEATARVQREREHNVQVQLERERAQMAFELKVREDQMQLDQEFRLRKLEENTKKLSLKAAKVAESFTPVPESVLQVPETFGKFADWRKVPESERKVIATLESAEKVAEIYGGSLKTCANWLSNARKEFPAVNGEQA